jgi:tetratricopeptide (TPR) repeat protein
MHSKRKGWLTVFAILLLCVADLVRSGIMIDKSFLPRFFSLSVLLLISALVLFRDIRKIRMGWFEYAFLLFYFWNLLSSFWAIAPSEAIMQSQLVFLAFAVFIIITTLARENPGFENIFIKIQMFVLLFAFGLGFYKMSSLDFFNPYQVISVSANNNLFSGFLLISLPLVLTGYSLNRGAWRYLSLLVMVLTVFFIIIVQSRAVYLGLFVSILVSASFLAARYPVVFSKRNILTGGIALALLAALVFLFYSSLDSTRKNYFLSKIPVWNYFKSYDNTYAEKVRKEREKMQADLEHISAFDFSEDYYENANLRVIFWKKSWCLVKSHPVLGVGAGNWRLAVPGCKNPPNPDHTAKNFTYSQPHNEWISIISELGIVGLVLAVFIFFVPLLFILYKTGISSPAPPVSAVFYVSFIAGFYIFCMFDFPLKRVEHNVLLFSILAFLFQKVPLKSVKSGIMNKIPGRLFSLLFLLLLGFTVFLSVLRMKGEYYTLQMFRNERKNDAAVIRYCRKAENAFYRVTPNTLPLDWFEGVARYRLGSADSAVMCFKKALLYTPYEVRVLNDYGTALFQSKRIDEAKSILLKAYDIDPYFDDAKFNLGAIYYFSGRRDSALYFIKSCRGSQKKEDFLKELQ